MLAHLQPGCERNHFDTVLMSFHQFSIDGRRKQRYSDPINGEDLVPAANPMFRLPHPIHVVPISLLSAPRFLTTHLHTVAVPAADQGGYFSA
jgi:hypothetical protein